MSRRGTTLKGESGPIRIDRDERGNAIITAKQADDALFGLGYCHARDRGLQMRLVRILGRGQACERLRDDAEMLEIDRFFRRLNFCGDAAEEAAALTPRARSGCDAYCRGVNQWFETRGVPWELRLLGDRAVGDPWRFADIYLTAKVIGYVSLAISQAEIERWLVECIQNGISQAQLEELLPGQLGGLDESLLRQIRLEERIVPKKLWGAAGLTAAMASNNWVVAGSKSHSGRPLAANDPHLQINRTPPFWYEAVLRWQSDGADRYAMGATVPGTPGVIVGRNPELAWTVTYAFMDCVDSWVEHCRDAQYRRGDDQWIPFRVRDETILRKRNAPVAVRFFENDHGTLEGDPHVPGYYMATRWSCGEQTGAMSLDGLLGMLDARDVEQGRACLGRLCNSSWNWLLADREGNIGYQMAGKMPLRREGVSGLIPLAGWDPANDWQGFATLADLPQASNPPEGILLTANNDLNHLGRVKPINLCVSPYRSGRIEALLSRPGPFGVDDMKAIQLDVLSDQAERFMTVLRPMLAQAAQVENARILRDWDLAYESDSKGAALFERFYRELLLEVFGGTPVCGQQTGTHLGAPVVSHLLDETTLLAEYYGAFDEVLLAERSLWFGKCSREQIFKSALDRALSGQAEPLGNAQRFELTHLLFGSKLPRFLGFDRGPFPLRGGRATVSQGQVLRAHGRLIVCGPSYRFVTDLATDEMHTNLPGGPSDRRFTRWYASGMLDWLKGRYGVLRGWGR